MVHRHDQKTGRSPDCSLWIFSSTLDRVPFFYWNIIFLVTLIGLCTPLPDRCPEVQKIFHEAEQFHKQMHDAEGRMKQAERNIKHVRNRESVSWTTAIYKEHIESNILEYQEKHDEAKAEYRMYTQMYENKVDEARAAAGIWSSHGISEARDIFWKSFWDIIRHSLSTAGVFFYHLSSGDFLLALYDSIQVSLTLALFFNWIFYITTLICLLWWGYQANPLSIVIFVMVFICCGLSWMYSLRNFLRAAMMLLIKFPGYLKSLYTQAFAAIEGR
eukprot:Rmarinus@m.469